MTDDTLATIYNVFSIRWPDFKLNRSKKIWIKLTKDGVLLLIQIQMSGWGAAYYANFGVCFLGMEPIEKPLTNIPKSSDWHLFARYERFQQLATPARNSLFSLEEADSGSLEARCARIADFSATNILPRLELFGDSHGIRTRLSKEDADAVFDPFRTQKIARKDILNFLLKPSAFDPR